METVWAVTKHALTITLFVAVMMLLVDYFNVVTQGRLTLSLRESRWRQYVVASFLAATPGCLGAFMDVSFYVHGMISFGAIVGAMVATSGDEAFVMLALFPDKALTLFVALFVLGIAFAWFVDWLAPKLGIQACEECKLQQVHPARSFEAFSREYLAENFVRISAARAVLLTLDVLALVAVLLGWIGPQVWNWKRVTFASLLAISAVIIGSATEHYVQEHIWKHIAKKHIWRVFLWSFFAILIVDVGLHIWNLEAFVENHLMWVLLIAVVVGIVPESGPHLVFVMLFARGLVPLSVLVASSIVQDGHGLLPLLSYSVKDAVRVKLFNLVLGLLVGGIMLAAGF